MWYCILDKLFYCRIAWRNNSFGRVTWVSKYDVGRHETCKDLKNNWWSNPAHSLSVWLQYIYIYIYISAFRQHFLVEAYLIKYYRHPLSTYYCFNVFISLIVVLIFGWNSQTNFPYLTGSQVLSCPSWAIIRVCTYCKKYNMFYLYWGKIVFFKSIHGSSG